MADRNGDGHELAAGTQQGIGARETEGRIGESRLVCAIIHDQLVRGFFFSFFFSPLFLLPLLLPATTLSTMSRFWILSADCLYQQESTRSRNAGN